VIAALEAELAKPEQEFKYTEYGLRGDENGKLSIGEIPRKPWVGLTSKDWENTPDTGKQGCERDAELYDWIEQTLKDKNEPSR
jgi:hypothetical protein